MKLQEKDSKGEELDGARITGRKLLLSLTTHIETQTKLVKMAMNLIIITVNITVLSIGNELLSVYQTSQYAECPLVPRWSLS